MNTENTDIKGERSASRWLLYDRDCGFCSKLVSRFRAVLHARGIRSAPLQDPWVAPALKLGSADLLQEMRVLRSDGSFTSGAAAVVELTRLFWWATPIRWLARLPGGMPLLNVVYKWIARNRSCARRVCQNPVTLVAAKVTRRTVRDKAWFFLVTGVLVPIFILHASALPRWILMWAIAGTIWFWLKVGTILHARAAGMIPRFALVLGYLFAWPGTDAISFFTPNENLAKPRARDWLTGFLNLSFGAALISVAPRVGNALLSGWLAMVGLVFVLHFGTFTLLSAAWRAWGVNALPLMDFPLGARTLGEFWGRRWNAGFSVPARRLLFDPVRRKAGPALALVSVFLVSGVVHELAISVPARGGLGLPTLYFLFQAAAILFERSGLGKGLGLDRGVRGHLFALGCAAAPAFWLFHPPFVERVILPFLHAIHSLKGALL